jgi:CoA-transferase family III
VIAAILRELGLPDAALDRLKVTGDAALPSCFPVTDLAVASIGAACLAISELLGLAGKAPPVTIDRRLASLWFGWSIAPQGWEMPSAWDAIAGDYRTGDGWIKLHTNAPHHRAAALAVLQCDATRSAMTDAVGLWSADALEEAVVSAGGCAATMRSSDAWQKHPQGQAVSAESLISVTAMNASPAVGWQPTQDRPLSGIRVLDLTRVLAGPVATRFLAGYGADVLRIDPPDWDEPGVIPEVTLGKRCIRLDLRENAGRAAFERLLTEADVLVHGYRAGALDGLGYGSEVLQSLRPGLIDVSLNAYGQSGPWAKRRGFDSLVQMSCGIADAGMAWRGVQFPVPLPVQALDHATGYLIAAAAVRSIQLRNGEGRANRGCLSLARTAKLLMDHKGEPSAREFLPPTQADFSDGVEMTDWGAARRVNVPAHIGGAPMRWDRPATALGSGKAKWLNR